MASPSTIEQPRWLMGLAADNEMQELKKKMADLKALSQTTASTFKEIKYAAGEIERIPTNHWAISGEDPHERIAAVDPSGLSRPQRLNARQNSFTSADRK